MPSLLPNIASLMSMNCPVGQLFLQLILNYKLFISIEVTHKKTNHAITYCKYEFGLPHCNASRFATIGGGNICNKR